VKAQIGEGPEKERISLESKGGLKKRQDHYRRAPALVLGKNQKNEEVECGGWK
jgi:hypothetical protein